MFGIKSSKSKWEKIASESKDGYFRDGIRTLIIPYKVSLKWFTINAECLESGNTYNSNFYTGCTLSMQDWCDKPSCFRPVGFPDWFLIAFPDVALWMQGARGKNYYCKHFDDIPESEVIDQNNHRFKISFLKKLIDAYIATEKLPLETAK